MDEYDTAMNWPRGKRHLVIRGLEELTRSLMEGDVSSLDASNDVEGWGPVNTFLTEASRSPGTSGKVVSRTLRSESTDGVVHLNERATSHKGDTDTDDEGEEIPDPIVAARSPARFRLADAVGSESPCLGVVTRAHDCHR